jgi:alpha 1,3-glucosidase
VGDVRVEKLVVLGLGKKPLSVVLDGGRELEWEFMSEDGVLVVKDPAVRVVDDWAVVVKLE